MRTLPIFPLLALILVACNRQEAKIAQQISDESLSRKIVGTWTNEESREDLASLLDIAADGSFFSKWHSNDPTNAFTGTWKIQNGNWISTLTGDMNNRKIIRVAPISCKIIRLDEHHLHIQAVDIYTNKLFR